MTRTIIFLHLNSTQAHKEIISISPIIATRITMLSWYWYNEISSGFKRRVYIAIVMDRRQRHRTNIVSMPGALYLT